MKNRINLLQKDLIIQTKFRHINKITYVAVGIYILVALLTGAGLFYLTNTRSNLSGINSKLVSDIQNLKEEEGLLLTLKNRVSLAKNIFSISAPTSTEQIEEIISHLPQSSDVTAVSTDESGVISLTVNSNNSADIVFFLDKMRAKKPASLILKSLNDNEHGGYSYSIGIK